MGKKPPPAPKLSERLADQDRRRRAEGFASEKDRVMWEEELQRRAHFEEEERAGKRVGDAPPDSITDQQLRTFLDGKPTPRDRVAARNAAAQVPSHLAEAQVALVARCTICGKPVTDGNSTRDGAGQAWHRRCP